MFLFHSTGLDDLFKPESGISKKLQTKYRYKYKYQERKAELITHCLKQHHDCLPRKVVSDGADCKLKMYKSVGFCSMSVRKELIKMISFLEQYQMPWDKQ